MRYITQLSFHISSWKLILLKETKNHYILLKRKFYFWTTNSNMQKKVLSYKNFVSNLSFSLLSTVENHWAAWLGRKSTLQWKFQAERSSRKDSFSQFPNLCSTWLIGNDRQSKTGKTGYCLHILPFYLFIPKGFKQ